MTIRIHALLIVAIVVDLITSTVNCDVRAQSVPEKGTPLINVFNNPATRPLASGQRSINVTPYGPYGGEEVRVTIEKEGKKRDGWGGMCIESGNPIDLSRYTVVTLSVSVKPIEVADKLDYKLERGPWSSAREVKLSVARRNGTQVQLTIPAGDVSQSTDRFCVAMLFFNMGDTEQKVLTLSNIRFWSRNP